MQTIPRKALWAVVAVLVGLAGLGVYQGMRRGAADQDAVEAGVLPTTTAAPNAKTASALSDAGLNEAQVREIARQEVRSALSPRPAPAPANDADEASDRPTTPSAPRLAPLGADRSAPPQSPAAAATGDAGQPPLF